MTDRSVRNLAHLESSASTARVLNLRAVHRAKSKDPDYLAHPLFKNVSLNTCAAMKRIISPPRAVRRLRS
jgi:hypothetical protein